MLFQKLLSFWDRAISALCRLQAWGTGDENGEFRWTYFIDIGPKIGVVGTNGKIHTLMGYWSVHHHLEKGKLTKRIPVRKDLEKGERLATQDEVWRHEAEVRASFNRPGGGMVL